MPIRLSPIKSERGQEMFKRENRQVKAWRQKGALKFYT